MPATRQTERTQAITAELVAAQAELHALLDALTDADWRRQSHNPGWTNGEMCFHMALGFFLLPLLRLMGHLPRGATKPVAVMLNLGTGPFNWVNGLGPRIGARVLRPQSLAKTFDWAFARALRQVRTIRANEWQRGMYYPTR